MKKKINNAKKFLIIFDMDDTLIYKSLDLDAVKKMLQRLREKAYLVVLTNGAKKTLQKQVVKYDLEPYFDGFYSRSWFFNRKPLPFKFNEIYKKYNIEKKNIYMIGDKKYTDILGAKLFGIKSVLVDVNSKGNRLFPFVRPDYTIKSILELEKVLN